MTEEKQELPAMTVEAMPATAAMPAKVEIDPQNPLPEASWFWRRVITIAITITILVFLWHILHSLHDLQDSESLLTLSKWLIGFDALVLTFYFIGPSAAELVNMIQTSKIMQRGIDMAAEGARRAGFPPFQRDSGPRGHQHPGNRVAAPSGPEIDAAPRSRS